MAPSFTIKNELKNDLHTHTYLLPETPKSGSQIDDFKHFAPEVPKHNTITDTQNPWLNYIFREERKNESKDDMQHSLANYTLPEIFKHGWTMQQSPQSDTTSSYAPSSSNGKTKLALPSLQATSAVSWPWEIKRDVPMMLPAKSVVASDETTSNNLPLGMTRS